MDRAEYVLDNSRKLPPAEEQAVLEAREQSSGHRAPPQPGDMQSIRWGIIFRNREGFSPVKAHDYYREYTILLPGDVTRGRRRFITGGIPGSPEIVYYSWTHYGDSGVPAFVRIR